MELRHLRYFVAVAEAGTRTMAAERKLHTSQPSLSRQIRNLESPVHDHEVSLSHDRSRFVLQRCYDARVELATSAVAGQRSIHRVL